MKKISLILVMAFMAWIVQPVFAQTVDTAKNHIEVKKKVKTGAHGRKVTKIKMEGKGTPGAVSGAAEGAATGKTPTPPPPPPAPPATPPANPTVVVVAPETDKKPEQPATTVTTTTETKPTPVQTTTTHTVSTATSTRVVHHVGTVHHKVAKKPVASASTKTTTTTTTVKN